MTLINSACGLASPALPYSARLEIVSFDESHLEEAARPFSFERNICDELAPRYQARER